MARTEVTYFDLEPMGFGDGYFGDPTDSDLEDGIKIHLRGFGDTTTYTDFTED